MYVDHRTLDNTKMMLIYQNWLLQHAARKIVKRLFFIGFQRTFFKWSEFGDELNAAKIKILATKGKDLENQVQHHPLNENLSNWNGRLCSSILDKHQAFSRYLIIVNGNFCSSKNFVIMVVPDLAIVVPSLITVIRLYYYLLDIQHILYI